MRVLVTGGAGYIGSHVVRELIKHDHDVVVFDTLVNGHRQIVDKKAELVVADIGDYGALVKAMRGVGAVIHLAGFIEVKESMKDPFKYILNNNVKALNVLRAMVELGITKIIFSSSAAVYGNPKYTPIDEAHPKRPVNCYGETKLVFERYLHWFSIAHGTKYVALRYFNASGADPAGDIGEAHEPETHLIPRVLQTAKGNYECFKIFGADYKTKDGTCVRDFVHVSDLATAHVKSLEYLSNNKPSTCFNVGIGRGFSVKEVVEACKQVTGMPIKVKESERREGDPAVLIADPTKIMETLGWKPRFTQLKEIVATAWKWEQNKEEVLK